MKKTVSHYSETLDFTPFSILLEIPVNTSGRECFPVEIKDNDVYEDMETFEIIISSQDSALVISQSVLTIVVKDDDCKYGM